jgi:hypothetical protein
MQEQKIVNGVNVDDLHGTIDAIKEQPTIAKFKFCATNQWFDGGHNRTTIRDFYGACQRHEHKNPFVFDADEPPVLLGEDQGANPVEYALTALAACVTTALVYHAAARGIHLEEVESRLEGDLDLRGFLGMDDNVRRGYIRRCSIFSPTRFRSPCNCRSAKRRQKSSPPDHTADKRTSRGGLIPVGCHGFAYPTEI